MNKDTTAQLAVSRILSKVKSGASYHTDLGRWQATALANVKLARIIELECSIDSKHLAVCGHILAGDSNSTAWMKVYKRVKKERTAESNCSRMLRNAENGTQEYIDLVRWKATATASEKLGLDQEWVLSRLMLNAERCLQLRPVLDRKGEQVYSEDPETGELAPLHTSDSSGANRSLELLGKHIGMFKEKVEHGVSNPLAEILKMIRDGNKGKSPLPSGE